MFVCSDFKDHVGFATSSFLGKCLGDPLLELLAQLQLISGVASPSYNFHERRAWGSQKLTFLKIHVAGMFSITLDVYNISNCYLYLANFAR